MIFAEYYNKKDNGEYYCLWEDRSIVILDGRKKLNNLITDAIEENEHRRPVYDAFRIFKGESILRANPITAFIPIPPQPDKPEPKSEPKETPSDIIEGKIQGPRNTLVGTDQRGRTVQFCCYASGDGALHFNWSYYDNKKSSLIASGEKVTMKHAKLYLETEDGQRFKTNKWLLINDHGIPVLAPNVCQKTLEIPFKPTVLVFEGKYYSLTPDGKYKFQQGEHYKTLKHLGTILALDYYRHHKELIDNQREKAVLG